MKTKGMIWVPLLVLCTAGYAQDGTVPWVNVANQVETNQSQSVSASGGDSFSDSLSTSTANVNINTTSVSDYRTRTPPMTTFPPHLPYWMHSGWGTIKAYFPNGPTGNDQIYETTFDPDNADDMREIRGVLRAVPHRGVLAALGGALNDVAVALFGKPDTYYRGRGLEIANSVVRDRRPDGKALLVFIDSNVDMTLLGEEGYAYVGKVSVEGDADRNWDQAYKAAVAEALLWDVDILLISGGMKGVTSGTNTTFPSAAGGYSQVNYSLSLLGGTARGVTEGKGKAVLCGEAYRYSPQTIERRRIPAALYNRIRARPWPVPVGTIAPVPVPAPAEITVPVPEAPSEKWHGYPARGFSWPRHPADDPWADSPSQAEPASHTPSEVEVPALPAPRATVISAPAAPVDPAPIPAAAPAPAPRAAPTPAPVPARARHVEPAPPSDEGPGITMSRELFEMAGFPPDRHVGYIRIR